MSKVNITQINAALGGVPLTATFITDTLKVATLPKQEGDKRAVYWATAEYVTICDRAVAFINSRKSIDPSALNGDRPPKKPAEPSGSAAPVSTGAGNFFGGTPAASADPFAAPAATGWF